VGCSLIPSLPHRPQLRGHRRRALEGRDEEERGTADERGRNHARVRAEQARAVRRAEGRHVERLAHAVRVEVEGIEDAADAHAHVRDLDLADRHHARHGDVRGHALRTDVHVRVVRRRERRRHAERERLVHRERVPLDLRREALVRLDQRHAMTLACRLLVMRVPQLQGLRLRGTRNRRREGRGRRHRRLGTEVDAEVDAVVVAPVVAAEVVTEFGVEVAGRRSFGFEPVVVACRGKRTDERGEGRVTERERVRGMFHLIAFSFCVRSQLRSAASACRATRPARFPWSKIVRDGTPQSTPLLNATHQRIGVGSTAEGDSTGISGRRTRKRRARAFAAECFQAAVS